MLNRYCALGESVLDFFSSQAEKITADWLDGLYVVMLSRKIFNSNCDYGRLTLILNQHLPKASQVRWAFSELAVEAAGGPFVISAVKDFAQRLFLGRQVDCCENFVFEAKKLVSWPSFNERDVRRELATPIQIRPQIIAHWMLAAEPVAFNALKKLRYNLICEE